MFVIFGAGFSVGVAIGYKIYTNGVINIYYCSYDHWNGLESTRLLTCIWTAYWVSFGPHGTRVPATKPGEPKNVLIGIVALLGATGLLWTTVRSQGELWH